MKFILQIFLVFMFFGCTTKVPMATKYKIDSEISIQKIKDSKCSNKNLKILQSFSSNMFMSKKMYYVEGDNKIYPYSEALWANTPNRIVSNEIYKMLRELNLFNAVVGSKSRIKTSWLLESKVEDFMQYYEHDLSSSYVKVIINLTLIDSKTSQVIATKVFKSKIKVQTLNASGGVEAFNIALGKILNDASFWMVKKCQ